MMTLPRLVTDTAAVSLLAQPEIQRVLFVLDKVPQKGKGHFRSR